MLLCLQMSQPVTPLKPTNQPWSIYVIQHRDEDSGRLTQNYYGPPPAEEPSVTCDDMQSTYQSNNMRLPYLLPPIHQTDLHKLKGTNRFRLYLSHGVITDAKKAQQVPQAVHDELYKVYGHVKQTEVVVVNEDGT